MSLLSRAFFAASLMALIPISQASGGDPKDKSAAKARSRRKRRPAEPRERPSTWLQRSTSSRPRVMALFPSKHRAEATVV